MTTTLPRRRVLSGLVGAGVVAAAAGALALFRREDRLGSVASTTTMAPTTAATAPTSASPAPSPTSTASVLDVLCRDAWGAAPAGPGRRHTIRQVTVHHSATRLDRNADVVEHLRRYQRDHQARGWVDLAYHYVVDAEGHVFEARSTAFAGDTATDYDPAGHFLAMCDGNFEEQPVPDAQFEGLARLLAWAVPHHGLDVGAISAHRAHAATACPGEALAVRIDRGDLARRVEALVAAGGVELRLVCGEDARARVAAIAST